MSEFSTEASIIAQTSAKVAGEVVAAAVAQGSVGANDVEDMLTAVTKNVFNDILGLAGAESIVDIIEAKKAQQKSGGVGGRSYGGARSGSAQRRGGSRGGAGDTPPGELAFNFGDYKGETIADIYEKDPEHIEWYAKEGRSEFMQKRCQQFLDGLEAA